MKTVFQAKKAILRKIKRWESLKNLKNFYLQGKYFDHNLYKPDLIYKSIDLSDAIIGYERRFRKDRKVFEKTYYVGKLRCSLHKKENSIVYARLSDLHNNKNHCWLCNSEEDIELDNLLTKHNLKRNTVLKLINYGLSLEEIETRYKIQESLNKNYTKQTIIRRKQYSKDKSLKEIIKYKIDNYDFDDERREKLINLIKILNFKDAKLKTLELNSKKIKYVTGIKCNLHPKERIGKRQLGRLLEGANPCKECIRIKNSKISKNIIKEPWTIEKVEKLLKKKEYNDLKKNFDFKNLKIVKIIKGKRNMAHLQGVICKKHKKIVKPILTPHLKNKSIFCSSCPSKNTYSESEIIKMVQESHGDNISLIEYGGGILEQSSFICRVCDHKWSTQINAIIGSTSNRPTGCPECSKKIIASETTVSNLLKNQKLKQIKFLQNEFNQIEKKLIKSKNSFYRNIKLERLNKKSLWVDFLVNSKGKILAIEVDGPQHYGLRYRNYKKNDFKKVKELDKQKIAILNKKKILTCRLPLPILGNQKAIEVEVINIIKGKPSWVGVPNINWIK